MTIWDEFSAALPESKTFELGTVSDLIGGATKECQHGCHDLKPDEADRNWWELVVDEGRATVRCATCECTYDPLLWDGAELLYTDEALPVQVQFDHCSSEWHGENRCDHGWTIGVSPRKRS